MQLDLDHEIGQIRIRCDGTAQAPQRRVQIEVRLLAFVEVLHGREHLRRIQTQGVHDSARRGDLLL